MAQYLVTPKVVSHCNARTEYEYIEHELNPDECIFCHELVSMLFADWRKTDE